MQAGAPQLSPAPATARPLTARSEATESLALWRGVEAASGARDLLHLCGSIDMDPTRGSSAGSEALGRMQDASKVGGMAAACLLACGWLAGGGRAR